MPWKETDEMNERIRYALAYESGLYTITELCTLYGISRPTAYKWMKRFDEGGVAALLQEERANQGRGLGLCAFRADSHENSTTLSLKRPDKCALRSRAREQLSRLQ